MKSKVAVVKGERGLDTVYRAINLIPLEKALQSYNRVLIKVNFITTKDWRTGATTDPVVVEALINRLKDLGKKIHVVESDAQTTNADKAVFASGMQEMLDRVGIDFINMRHLEEKVKIPIQDGKTLNEIKVAKIATDSAIISAAKLKTHTTTKVTLGMKNMFGMLTTKWKGKFHLRDMDKVIRDINSVLPPHVVVIDGFVGMEGKGPVHGSPVKMNTIIAGTDPVATDATAARIMGFDPHEINHIIWAHQSGIGNIEKIEIVGSKMEDVIRPFERF
ncbi:DUF362 domain-containing protein [Candidatus Bathyarchaeota archaeon]|nr:DUF362 domain-containing protein [Candidatus Bathyarchaeota archaeon]